MRFKIPRLILPKMRLPYVNVAVDTPKILRLLIASFMFATIFQLYGQEPRISQQMIFNLGVMALFTLIIDNIWVMLFSAWTLILFGLYRCQFGQIYAANIFSGMILYYLTKLSFKKEHIDFYIKIFLWFVFLNLSYCILQVTGKDYIFSNAVTSVGKFALVQNTHPGGFMLNEAWMGMLIVIAIPLIATRRSIWLGALMFIPLFIARSFTNTIAAGVVFLFILFFRVKRWVFFVVLIGCILACLAYYFHIDKPGFERFDVWLKTINCLNVHPFIGWGLDSFRRNDLPHKNFIFAMGAPDGAGAALWDNPHNLYISMAFEFGIIGLIIFFGYLRQLTLWFKRAIKEPNTLGLAGVVVAVLFISIGNFPMFLSRFVVFIIPLCALLEVQLTE